jgi:ankyrin repeat protein
MVKTVPCLIMASLAIACVSQPLPEPAPLRLKADTQGYPIASRPACGPATLAGLGNRYTVDADALIAAAKRGEPVTCGPAEDPQPLDMAVALDRPDAVRVLLEAGADPNARWSWKGDRFPLQAAIESQPFGGPRVHRREIVRLLLQHGADPNARWCPFESRGGVPPNVPGCESASGVTPLIGAASYDQADITYLLLDAGADPAAMDGRGFSALDYATGRAVFELILAAQFPDPVTRRAQATNFRKSPPDVVWLSPPPPPPPPRPTNPVGPAPASASARE